MADVYDTENWCGPFESKEEALEAIEGMCGNDVDAVIWQRSDGFWTCDGIDPDTGVEWLVLPESAEKVYIP